MEVLIWILVVVCSGKGEVGVLSIVSPEFSNN